jgi:hypothetical protein
MATISSRNSVLGVVTEVTQNLLRLPQSATDYVPLQEDFAIEPNYDQIENLEIKSSIGRAASIQGGENPTASLSFYLKGSGTEGSAPQWGDIARSFFGTQTIESTQRVTAAASTFSQINVTGAAAAGLAQGYGVLIKDPVHGYRVRVVHEVATNHFHPSFNLPPGNAPGTSVGLGKPVYYTPANSGHPSLSLWWYGGNGGATQAVSGALINDFSYSMTANDSVNASAGFDALGYFFDPIFIASTDTYIDFTDDDGTDAAAIASRWYKDPHELAEAITTAMNASGTTETHLCEYVDATGRYKFTSTGTVLSLLWNTGTNAANSVGDKLGFSVAADDTGVAAATGYTADNAQSYAAPHTPSFDPTAPIIAKNQEVMLGDATDYACFNPSEVTVSLTNGVRKIEDICAESGRSAAIINSRECEITVTALLNQYDASQLARFRNGDSIRFQTTMGAKSGGNWVPGTVVYSYAPQSKITAISITNDDGLVSLQLTLQPFVSDTGTPEFYLGQL